MALASVALAQARTLLNDDAASVWTDAVLIPKLQIAHQELQTELWNSGSPVVRAESSLIAVGIGDTDLGSNQPADMITPTKLFEYTSVGVYYGEMTEVFYIPLDIAQGATLEYWAWRGEKILFLGSTAARKVKIQYRKLITVPTLSSSDLGILFAELYCGPRVAALAAGSVGNGDVLKTATDMAAANFAKVITANRGQQHPVGSP